MSEAPAGIGLDESVERALSVLEPRAPRALLLLATGAALFAERLAEPAATPLAGVEGVPEPWRGATLYAGLLGDVRVWLLEDPLDERPGDVAAPAWTGGFPCWLAAAAGARVCVHASAGGALPAEAPLSPGTLALVSDHVNPSGRSPLVGLGESRLGPLFPDLSRLHHAGLRAAAIGRARELGVDAREAVVACTRGPSLETPAESRWLARSGAHVAVQGLARPLLAAGHAGLAVLAIVAVAAAAGEETDVAELVRGAQRAAPALEDLIVALAPDLADVAGALAEELP